MKIYLYFIVSIALSVGIYLTYIKRITPAAWVICLSLLVLFGGSLNISDFAPFSNNSMSLGNKVSEIEKELKNLKLKTADIDNLESTSASFDKLETKHILVTEGPIESVSKDIDQSFAKSGLILNNDNHESPMGDVQFKGHYDNRLFYLNSSLDMIGIGINIPHTKLEINGQLTVDLLKSGHENGSRLCVDKNNVLCTCGFC